MPDFTSVKVLSLDEGFKKLDEIYQMSLSEENMDFYTLKLNSFLGFYKNTDKLKNLKSYEYIVEVRLSTKMFELSINNCNSKQGTYLTNEQINHLQVLNDYLNTPEASQCILTFGKFYKRTIIPIIIILVVSFIFIFIYAGPAT